MTSDELRRLAESNARVIQALADTIAGISNTFTEESRCAQKERSELRQAMLGLANLMSSLDSDRPTVLRNGNIN